MFAALGEGESSTPLCTIIGCRRPTQQVNPDPARVSGGPGARVTPLSAGRLASTAQQWPVVPVCWEGAIDDQRGAAEDIFIPSLVGRSLRTSTAMASAPTPAPGDDWHALYNRYHRAIYVDDSFPDNPLKLFASRPLTAPLLFPNVSSDARDHCANERTFLSWLRLSVYLAVVSVAILINFHLKSQPSDLEVRLSHPLGIVFWCLALACLATGCGIYMRTVAKYAHRRALVQSGVKTQFVFGVTATAIIAACAIFLGAEVQARQLHGGHD